jgi:CHASE1-domain containing sensor protein
MYLQYLYRRLKLRIIYLFIALAVFGAASLIIEAETTESFDRDIYSVVKDVSNKSELFANILYAYRGLHAAKQPVTERDWQIYSKSINETARFSSDIFMSYIENIRDSEITDRSKYLELSNLDYHYIIKYSRNTAIGFDLTSTENRLAAMLKARDTGLIQTSAPITAVDDEDEKAIVIYQALYTTGLPRVTPEELRAALDSFVSLYIPVNTIAKELFELDESSDIRLRILDIEADEIVYANSRVDRFNIVSKTVNVDFGGRLWEVEFENYRTHYFKFSHVFMLGFIGIVGIYLIADIYVLRAGIKDYKKLMIPQQSDLDYE